MTLDVFDGLMGGYYGITPSMKLKLGKAGTAAPCTTDNDSVYIEQTGGFSGSVTSPKKVGQSFTTPGAGLDLTAYNIDLGSTIATGNVTAELRTDDSGKPSSTMVAGTQVTLPLTVGMFDTDFILDATVALSAGTTYWLIVYPDATAAIYTKSDSDAVANSNYATATNGVDWTAYPTLDLKFKVYGCTG